MRELQVHEWNRVEGGISDRMQTCIETGALGLFGGGFLGGLIVSPFAYALINKDGLSVSHYVSSILILGIGAMGGALIGSIVGTGTGLLGPCHHSDH